jgi:hypothetical protein
MELFKNTRLKIGKAILSKKMAATKRKVYYSNISLIKNIGIVWDSSRPEDFVCLSRFYQKMHERKIEVKILGYFPGKNLPDQYTAIRYLTCIRKEEINFFYIPVSSEAKTFMDNRFEILIDVNFKKLFTLQYITSLSNAGFKVGLFEAEDIDTPFDLLMDIKNPVDVENYLNQIIHYLEMINSREVKTVDK